MTDVVKNIAASVKARLKSIAVKEHKQFDFLLLHYMIERLLYRLSISKYAEKFVLKGGLLLYIHLEDRARPTRDVDFLARRISNDEAFITQAFQEICVTQCNDGVVYGADHMVTERIKEDAEYGGLRIKFKGYLGNASQTLQFDIGFGDVVVPNPTVMNYPVLLDMDSPEIYTYSIESVVAEKFEAMISLALLNSRMKDFYDIYNISEKFDMDGRVLYEAVFETFQRRGTDLQPHPVVFTTEFLQDPTKQLQWTAFTNRTVRQKIDLAMVLERIGEFLGPLYQGILNEREFFGYWDSEHKIWKPTGPAGVGPTP
jgi:predicted nucleotidyltransferase component of viral defense system